MDFWRQRVDKEETDGVEALRFQWKKLRGQATTANSNLQNVQAGFKRDLTRSVKAFITDVAMYRSDWDTNGPMVPGIPPMEAVDRLKKFENSFSNYKRKWDTYSGGEDLFGLPVTDYPELTKTKKEVDLLEKVYKNWFALDGVYFNREHVQTLASLTTPVFYSEKRSRVPYTPWYPTHYIYLGTKEG